MSKNTEIDQKRTIRALKKEGFSVETGCTKLAFVLDDLGANQKAYQFIINSNIHLVESFAVNITGFVRNIIPPCIPPDFAIYQLRDTVGYDGILVATSAATALQTTRATRAKRYYYVYDLEWDGTYPVVNKEVINNILIDPKVVKFTRCDEYRKRLENAGAINVHSKIVPNFEINKIMEITNEGV